MKIKKFMLVDINSNGEEFEYIYAVLGKSYFKNVFFKFIFTSKFPHYLFAHILNAMKWSDKLWEDMSEKQETDLVIGSATHKEFGPKDFEKYGKTISRWTELLDTAIEKQNKLTEEYEMNIGPLDLMEPIQFIEIRSGQLLNEITGTFKGG